MSRTASNISMSVIVKPLLLPLNIKISLLFFASILKYEMMQLAHHGYR